MELQQGIDKSIDKMPTLSADYQYIRGEAIKRLDEKIQKLQTAPGSYEEEIARIEKGIEKLNDDSFISRHAEANSWEALREKSEDDEQLIIGLVNSAIESK